MAVIRDSTTGVLLLTTLLVHAVGATGPQDRPGTDYPSRLDLEAHESPELGKEFELTCSWRNENEDNDIRWKYNGNPVNEVIPEIVVTSESDHQSTLTISSVGREHQGEYTCYGYLLENPLFSEDYVLDLQLAPEIYSDKLDDVHQHDDVTITCKDIGKTTELKWYFVVMDRASMNLIKYEENFPRIAHYSTKNSTGSFLKLKLNDVSVHQTGKYLCYSKDAQESSELYMEVKDDCQKCPGNTRCNEKRMCECIDGYVRNRESVPKCILDKQYFVTSLLIEQYVTVKTSQNA